MINILNKKIRTKPIMRLRILLILTVLIAVTGCFISVQLGKFDRDNKINQQKLKILSELTTLRAKLLGEITSTFNLTQGLTHLISYNGDISERLFNAMSKQAIRENKHIRNIALAPDNVIRWIFPLEGNEKAVGLKYFENAEQRGSVMQAMELGKPVLAGPVNLIQGGKGFINRSPIFIENEKDTVRRYWGVASIVAYVDKILFDAGVSKNSNLNILLRGKDGKGQYGDIIWGKSSILEQDPVFIDVVIPGGKWQLAATPKNGWPKLVFFTSEYFLFGILFTALICSLILLLIFKNQSIRLKNLELAYEISERKKVEVELVNSKETAESANRMKTIFLANMSHEIRTPMNAILGFTDLMLNKNLSISDSNKYLEIINNSTRQLLNVINDIIDISIIEAGQLKINLNQVDINKLISNNIEINQYAAKRKNLELVFKPTLTSAKATVYIDEFRLNQIINNLITNAIKYTKEGMVEVGYKLRESKLEFYVKDTGIGISAENQNRIFEMFMQVDDNTSNISSGTGLGLAICKSLVEKMGGHIWVESRIDEGSIFYFTLPYHQVNINESIAMRIDHSHQLILKNKQILIAEDDEASYLLLNELLQTTGAQVTWVNSGTSVLETISRKPFDLIFLDIKLPGMNGIDVLKELHKKKLETPVVAHTAFAMNNDKDKAIEAGFDYYISKPIDYNYLFELLKLIFNK